MTLFQNNLHVLNQSIVDTDEITIRSNDLLCLTNFDMGSASTGSWYFPDGREISNSGSGFIRIRGSSFVALTSAGLIPPPSGLYRCEIPDSNGQNVTLFAGIYRAGQGIYFRLLDYALMLWCLGIPEISSPIEYNSSTLTCISSGGPATTVTWTRNNAPISETSAPQQQQLTDTATATYHNLLIITSSDIRDYRGRFACTISNSRGISNTQILEKNGKLDI